MTNTYSQKYMGYYMCANKKGGKWKNTNTINVKHPSQMVFMMIRNYIYEDKNIVKDDQRFLRDQKNSDGQEICTFRNLLCTAMGNKYSCEGCISLQGNYIICISL